MMLLGPKTIGGWSEGVVVCTARGEGERGEGEVVPDTGVDDTKEGACVLVASTCVVVTIGECVVVAVVITSLVTLYR